MRQKICWLAKDYQNDSLNTLAKRVTEFHTAMLLNDNFDVEYSCEKTTDTQIEIGKLFLDKEYTVNDLHVVNDILNFNVYYDQNTEVSTVVNTQHYGTFDCLVSLAAGNKPNDTPKNIGLTTNNHYIIDISPTAIHKSFGIHKDISSFTQLDIFNIQAVKEFLASCSGTKGLFVVSNCFVYYPSCLIYDVKLRLQAQEQFINALANDKIDWYVEMVAADGTGYGCVNAKDVRSNLDTRFGVLPWI